MNSYLYILFYKKLTPVWSKKKKKNNNESNIKYNFH